MTPQKHILFNPGIYTIFLVLLSIHWLFYNTCAHRFLSSFTAIEIPPEWLTPRMKFKTGFALHVYVIFISVILPQMIYSKLHAIHNTLCPLSSPFKLVYDMHKSIFFSESMIIYIHSIPWPFCFPVGQSIHPLASWSRSSQSHAVIGIYRLIWPVCVNRFYLTYCSFVLTRNLDSIWSVEVKRSLQK